MRLVQNHLHLVQRSILSSRNDPQIETVSCNQYALIVTALTCRYSLETSQGNDRYLLVRQD